MNPFRTYISHPEDSKGDFWIEKIVLHHLMPPNNLNAFYVNKACFFSYYHRPIQVVDKNGHQDCSSDTLVAWTKGTPIRQGHNEQQWENSYIIFGGPFAEECLDSFSCNQALSIKNRQIVLDTYDAIFRELSEYDPVDMRIIRNLLQNLLRTISRDVDTKDIVPRIPQKYLMVKQFISDNYAKPIQIPELAEMIEVSLAHFSKRFKHYFSCSPIQYLISVRMEQAAYLMLDPNLSLSGIAQMVGFNNIHYFSRMVKNYHGQSPRFLRRKLMNKAI